MKVIFFARSLKKISKKSDGYLPAEQSLFKSWVKTLNLRCDVLRDLVPFVQFKKHEKHPQRRVTFSKVLV